MRNDLPFSQVDRNQMSLLQCKINLGPDLMNNKN